ncbi:hypothetical protein B566_EDAN015666 [Ephemera danica]|nr:hypothetical protein B566_EDAN015666 [Ephemera danica]
MSEMQDRKSPNPHGEQPPESPDENGVAEDAEMQQEEDEESPMDEEFLTINSQLDQISSVLDVLEQKNDHLQAQLRELLESNRQDSSDDDDEDLGLNNLEQLGRS